MSVTRIGMIGYNDGNGHPFSFSAIINGYNENAFANCPYPVINEYLSARKKQEFGIGDMKVTHVWAPSTDMSDNIASYSFIPNQVKQYEEMIGQVDAVIIARDDAESHREIATPFLKKGIKVFVDKPLCKTQDDLIFFKPYLEDGQLMSCSGLRFFPPIQALQSETDSILFAHGVAPLDWFKYGIHVIEGLIPLFGGRVVSVHNIGEKNNDIVRIEFESGKFMIVQVNESLAGGIRASIYTKSGSPRFVHFNDNFTCFKNQLSVFFDFITKNKITIDHMETVSLMKILMAGAKSKYQQQKISFL
jgi:hypothetical protein